MGHDGLLSADKAGETGRRLWSVARLEGAKQIYGELFQTKRNRTFELFFLLLTCDLHHA